MQIRAGTRQDEPIIRTIIFQALEEHGIKPDLEGRDCDLRNVEHSYFWYDGLCIVAERDGQIIGVLGARCYQSDEKTLKLLRLAVTPGARKRGVARALVKTMRFFAGNMGYEKISFAEDQTEALRMVSPIILEKLGFRQDPISQQWFAGRSDKCASSA